VSTPWEPRRRASRHAWADRNAAGADELSSVRPVGLTSLRFVALAIRRRALLGCAVVLAGLAVTAAIYVLAPPAYQASTSILITNDLLEDPNIQMQGNVVIAQGATVAAGALRRLGLTEPARSFMRTYSVTFASDRLLVITTNAPSVTTAMRRARALAGAFLQARAVELRTSQKLGVKALGGQIVVDEDKLGMLASQIARMAPSENRRDVEKQYAREASAVGALKFDRDHYPVTTASMIQGTSVFDPPAPIPPSRKHLAAIFGAAGFFASLATGLGVVIIGAVTSNRLRRRDDVARALGAPIKLSVGKIRPLWALARPHRLTRGSRHQRRIVAHLRNAVADGGTALAVVPVDNAPAVASSVASLAISCAREGRRVVLADLSAGTPAARLLGASEPGLHEVFAEGTSLTVAIPERYDVVPVGPIRPLVPSWEHRQANRELAAACASADLLLSAVTLDPSLGGDHLATWSTDVVVMVTAGRSVAAKIHATGEMIKLAGTRLCSAVLLDADKKDESPGAVRPSPGWQRPARL
jgi:capsular polysaccharide biosynthesis protein